MVELDCDGGFSRSLATDGDGMYLFTDVPADDCVVTVDPTTAPDDKVPGMCPQKFEVALSAGESFLDADFCFVKVIDSARLLMPDVAGNRLFQSYQNMDSNPHVGLLFMIPGVNDTVRVNGTVTIVSKEELERQKVELELYWTDDNSKHLQGIIINVEEAYGHCPRAYNFAKLWDTDQIAENQANRPIPLRP